MSETGKSITKSVLKTYWGHDDFRGLQEPVIQTVLTKQDCVVVLPTGGGKSLCYQLPTMVNEGLCIVVSPLIALIKDQVYGLNRIGIKALELSGGVSFEDTNIIMDNCLYGGYKFLYLSPERLQQPMILNRLAQLKLSLIAIDEAHCISQWGHDFRPAYGKLSVLKDLFPKVPIIALSATATEAVIKDIIVSLNLSAPKVFKDNILRPNISYVVEKVEDKTYRLLEYLKPVSQNAIIYVRSRNHTIDVAMELNASGFKAAFYHGGMPSHLKEKQMSSWMKEENRVMVATSAFGMGIDKSKVKLIVHLDLPESLEAYYQESGRAGRNNEPAKAVILWGDNDGARLSSFFIDQLPTVDFIKSVYRHLCSYLQIAYGELNEQLYHLDFISFCGHFHLQKNSVYQVLKILDQHSIISLRDNFRSEFKIKFNQSSHELLNYLHDRTQLAEVVLPILRSYTNCFEYLVNIDLNRVAHAANTSIERVLQVIEQLHKENVLSLERSDSDVAILFLEPREDDKTINRIAKDVEKIIQGKIKRVKDVQKYVQNNQQCRAVQLSSYFSSTSVEGCGHCSVCMTPKTMNESDLKSQILSALSSNPRTSRELVDMTHADPGQLTACLKKLLAQDQIKVSLDNRYSL